VSAQQGKVKACYAKDKRPGEFNVYVEGIEGSLQTKQEFSKGDLVEFELTGKSWGKTKEVKFIKKVESEAAPAAPSSSGSRSSPSKTGISAVDMNSAAARAIEFVDLAIRHNALPLGEKPNARLAVIEKSYDRYVAKFYHETRNGPGTAPAPVKAAPKAAGKPAAKEAPESSDDEDGDLPDSMDFGGDEE
jgi:hypothetical protein